jgi:hypothetical protein
VGGRSHVVFLLPIAPGLGRGPTAIAMIGGLLVATHLTLVLLPTINVVVLMSEWANGPKLWQVSDATGEDPGPGDGLGAK